MRFFLYALCFGLSALAAPAAAAQRASALVEVSDMAAAVDWYTKIFKLRIANTFKRSTFEQQVLIGPDLILEVVQHKPAAERRQAPALGPGKFGFEVADLDAELKRIEEAGMAQRGPLVLDEAIGLATFLLRDPDGNIVQLFGKSRGPFAITVQRQVPGD